MNTATYQDKKKNIFLSTAILLSCIFLFVLNIVVRPVFVLGLAGGTCTALVIP